MCSSSGRTSASGEKNQPLTWEEAGSKQRLGWDYADMMATPAKPAACSQLMVGITEKSA
jgi:hypothetical protein